MFRSAAEAIGCWIAPIPIVGVGVVESILYTRFNAIAILLLLLIVYISALGFTLVFGYPLYRLLARLNAFRWWTSVLSGFAIGAAASALIGHHPTLLSKEVLINASAAAASGLLFWLIQQGRWRENVSA
ncbi:hypothetical protein [Dyella mobilis]|uniref:Uncharacterized protein n=1 Tax=Dyella mobilis TaxID=1849582 RepID=A0ABS2KE69_9GAMM|nr:hypothetical protein [Dyella mobilis]MBM7129476.1 hypothetical protein [Dyella mobilis]GLQ98260.1 hypothetical protein GCM10007863_26800 [Dyella mobilis]